MASTRRKAAAAGLAIIGIAGLSLASAAQLNVTTQSLGAGNVAVGSCDPDGVAVSWSTAASTSGYTVDAMGVDGIASTCIGLTMKVSVGDDEVFAGPVTGATASITGLALDAEAVTDVAVVIYG